MADEFTGAARRPPGVTQPPLPPRSAPVTLREITRDDVRAVCDLRVTPAQRPLVGPAAYTVAEGVFEPGAVLRAIYAADVVVGVLLVEVDSGTPYLIRFLIDAAYQASGFGRRAVDALCAELAAAAWEALEVTFVPVDGGARDFWVRCGFTDTGRIKDDEPVFVRTL